MARFAALHGTRSRTPKTLEVAGQSEIVDFRLLNVLEGAQVLERAREFAIERKASPTDDDPLYELGIQVHTLALAFVDHDSPVDAPAPYFGSYTELLQSEVLTPDLIGHWFELYAMHVDEVGVLIKSLSDSEILDVVRRSVGGDSLPFLLLRPGTRWALFRILAVPYLTLRLTSLPVTAPSTGQETAPST